MWRNNWEIVIFRALLVSGLSVGRFLGTTTRIKKKFCGLFNEVRTKLQTDAFSCLFICLPDRWDTGGVKKRPTGPQNFVFGELDVVHSTDDGQLQETFLKEDTCLVNGITGWGGGYISALIIGQADVSGHPNRTARLRAVLPLRRHVGWCSRWKSTLESKGRWMARGSTECWTFSSLSTLEMPSRAASVSALVEHARVPAEALRIESRRLSCNLMTQPGRSIIVSSSAVAM